MISRLVLVRHGETLDNARGVAQGWSDSELSPAGREQAERVAERIASLGVTALYCSTLPRAMTTAEAIGRVLGMTPVALDDLRELNCGDWEGEPFHAIRESDPEFHRKWFSDPMVACPGGESFHDVRERLQRAFAHIEEREAEEPHSTPVIVSHGTAIRIAATSLLGLSLHSARLFAQDNAAINVFERRNGQYVLRLWNDATHCGIL